MTAHDRTAVEQAQIATWITDYIAKTLGIPSSDVDRGMDLENLGLNSALVVSMIGDLEDWLGVELSPAIIFEFRTIDAIASHLAVASEPEPLEALAGAR